MTAQGASFARTKILMFIASHSPARSVDISRGFGFAPRTVTEAIDNLERDGLVRREADVADRRAKTIVLTPAGAAAIAASEPMRRQLTSQLFDALDEAERTQLTSFILRLSTRLEQIDDEFTRAKGDDDA
ncbi:MAG TPA: MarR family winged helix-turn-helix transcriptional regulator [Sphingomonas sp.]